MRGRPCPRLRHINGRRRDDPIQVASPLPKGRAMYQRILVPVDGSPTSRRGLEEAIHLAQLTKGRLRLIHVVDELSFAVAMDAYSGYAGDWLGVLRKAGQGVLDDAKGVATKADVEVEAVLSESFHGAVHE